MYRSDFRELDDKLYKRVNKFLHEQDSNQEKDALLEDSGLLPEFGEAAVAKIEDPIERAEIGALRKYHRDRTARHRANIKARKTNPA